MIEKAADLFRKFIKNIPESKKPMVLVMAGVLLLVLIFFSDITPSKNDVPEESESNEITYVQEIEDKLRKIVSDIHGAGETEVMLTLDTSEENIYATDINEDKYEYVVIKTSSDEGGLLLKIIQPKIRGVAIVCEGGDSYKVKNDIMSAVCSVLDISSSRVSITRMKNREGD